ncbi:MAG: hypothetical protein KAR42_11565 [candidate division Zixibacteria bacterium]|nr:hypothetical protein [candidate division Zixibacteria bacterium]
MEELRQIEQRLHRVILRNRLILFGAGTVGMFTTFVGLWIALSTIAFAAILPVAVKISLLSLGAIAIISAFYWFIIRPYKSGGDIIRAALKIEEKHPGIKGRLVAALQFRNMDISRTNFSPALIAMTGRQAKALTSDIDFNEIVSGYPLFRKLRSGAAMTAAAIIIGVIAPGFFSNALEVYSKPTEIVAPPPGFSITVQPGNADRVKYTDIEVGGILIGGSFPKEIEVFYQYSDGRWQSEKLTIEPSGLLDLDTPSRIIDSLPFGITLKQVRRSFDYFIVAGDISSQRYAVNIVDRPRVTDIKLTISFPSYTKLPEMVIDENNGSFAALVGSRVSLEVGANRNIHSGYLVIDDSSKVSLNFNDAKGFTDFKVNEDFSYHIRLHDAQGEQNPDPIEYLVTAIPDEYPLINVLSPGYDVNLDERMMLPFTLHISDDFGFSSLTLKYQIVSGGVKSDKHVAIINYSSTIENEGEVSFNWDVDVFNLLPSDYILYNFELADNDRISGPKITSTRVYAARLPSIDEIVMQTETQQEGRVFEAEKILQEQREMAEKLKQLSQELQTSEKLNWQDKKELENIVDQQMQTAENLEKIAKQMEESVKELEQNDLISEQILKKLTELQKLFNEIATPEMKEAMKKLAEDLKDMNPDEMEQAMKDFQLSQEEMLKRLERSVELLKKMQIEQKMAAMLKMIQEMLLEQNRVNVETEQSRSDKNNPQLAQREKNLQKQMDALKSEAEKLDKLLNESPKNKTDKHVEFSEAVKQNQAKADMQQMEQQLAQNEKESALPHGEEASEKLSQLSNQMQQLMDDISGQQGQEMAEKMHHAIDDANYLSREQESIYNNSKDSRNNSEHLRQIAAEQQILKEAVGGLTERINEMAQQSPFLAAEIRAYLEETQQLMQGACDNLGERRGTASLGQQRDAIYNLNRASIKLLDALENQKQCNKGGSCNKQSQKMQSLCQKQNQINKKTQGQCNNPGNKKLSESQRQSLQRLAGEQGAVRKSMQELQKEFGNRRDILGRLDALSNEIREIEELLEEGSVGGDLLDRQIRVYSRMLDVQKSLNRRDFSRERRAITSEDIFKTSPGALDNDNAGRGESLQDRLNRYLRDGYPRQYEQQIKAYFKAITTMGQESTANEK